MASTYKVCNCPGCFETIVGDDDGVNLCDDCNAADCDPFADTTECRAAEQACEEAEEAAPCPQCGGEGQALGQLGSRVILRCRQCGWEF